MGLFSATTIFTVAGHGSTAASVDWSRAQLVELRMVDYEFIPNQLRFHHGQPYQLHLVNAGKEGHDFSAPDFLASVELKAGAPDVGRNSVFLQPLDTADIYFIAHNTGLFAPRCADHDWAGMTATIIVD
jgi:uncharacterized cupredoxin-like copper-binding protein